MDKQNTKSMNLLKSIAISGMMVLLSTPIFAQKSYMSLIEDGKFEKAQAGLTAQEEKYPNDLMVNYEWAVLYATSAYANNDVKLSLDYSFKAYKLWNLIQDQKQRKSWQDKGITETSLRQFVEK